VFLLQPEDVFKDVQRTNGKEISREGIIVIQIKYSGDMYKAFHSRDEEK
jgi:hypothetical protein